ncbi:MAG: aminotransferase class I/II-fold pyridoxal phosphate-dependent enzyme [Candidatus Bathyarchaeia archaeon]|jgi:aminotransferase
MSKKLQYFTESVIREMTRLSEQQSAINLSQGMPDFDPPEELVNAAVKALKGGYNQYPITWGQKSLRDAIAHKVKDYNGIDADPDKNVTVTCGATEAVTASVLALTDPGDKIIVTDPFYENYVPDAILAGTKLVYVPFEGKELKLSQERLKTAMEKHPKLIVINTPNNPTGKVLSRTELTLIADLCEDFNCIAITDEIYEHIIYDGNQHVSIASIGNMTERTVTVSGASKTYSVTGWRVGWVVANENLSNAIRKIHDYLTIGAPTPLQEALTTALRFPIRYYKDLAEMYDKKRKMMMKALDGCKIQFHRPEGAYYILAEAPEKFSDGQEFTRFLLENAGIAVLPAVALYHNTKIGGRKIRLAFCKKDDTLHEVERRLAKAKLT